ncbi:oligogalacturonate-specific porin KdgM family protein [Photobacterium sp. DNB23_23_1]
MKKTKIFVLALTSMIASTSVSAATLMLRQEHKSNDQVDANTNATLVKIGGSIGNTFIGTQIIHKGKNLNNYTLGSTEMQLGYRYDVNDDVRLVPQLQVTAVSSGIIYTPMAAMVYKLGGGFSLEPKYKHKFHVGVKDGEYNDTKQTSQYQMNLNYAKDALRLGIQYDYHKALDGQTMYNNKGFKQELELKAYYQVAKGLTPFVTFAGVPEGNKSDKYQLRSRVGLLYSF